MMTEIEKTEGEIKVLQAKLELLKELENHKSPVEECYKDWWGQYPELETDGEFDVTRWHGFRAGYHFAYEENVSETPQERVERVHKEMEELIRESVKWCEEHPDESVEDYLKPQTPEQVADGLKEAFRESVKQGVVSSTTKPQTLYEILMDWWINHLDMEQSDEQIVDGLVERIKHWLPKEQSAAGSQNAYVECSVEGFNDCINKIRRKLR